MTDFLGLHPDLVNMQGIIELLLRIGIDLFFTGIIILGSYMRKYGKNEYIFTYVMLNLITFMLCYTLRQVPIDLGFALGLFAVFGILRYRTEAIRTHNLTYLFVVIGLGILNAVVNDKISLSEVLLVNTLIATITIAIEQTGWFSYGRVIKITYDGLDPMNNPHFLEDLRTRTGLPIQKYRIESIDMVRGIVKMNVTIHENKS
ncbi:MAG: hypothetical protein CL916_04250 [Deltaproteobacteria bacterium]|nr:hypothetical protein [Deltaproteobacteria bacterium]